MDYTQSPPVAAVFLVIFDQKVGYTIAWKRSLPNVDIEGIEYKSLPSGLHAVKEDLVYFVQNGYAGVSAFVQEEADAQHRNASFAAVGALVPLSYGQLGRSWVHAAELRRLAREVVKNVDDKRSLELFWQKHKSDDTKTGMSASPSAKKADVTGSPETKKRKRAMSEATLAGFNADLPWAADHPALYIPTLLDTFGPLLFPLHRAALARKRVLLLGSPSVQANANAVYLTSVLANVTPSQREALPVEADSLFRSSPLFSIGISDIPFLASRKNDSGGWIACTTDDILGEKKDLYDVIVQLPSSEESKVRKIWPKLRTSAGEIIKASQRDLRRWTLLRRELRRLRRQIVQTSGDIPASDVSHNDSDERPLLQRSRTSTSIYDNTGLQNRDESDTVEAATWSAMAYRGFIWWASAGDAAAWENDETQADEELLFDLPSMPTLFPDSSTDYKTDAERETEYARAAATLVVAYFRRITGAVLKTLGNVIEEADDETEEGVQEDDIDVFADDIQHMGLDSWSLADKTFVKSMVRTWFGREAKIVHGGVRVCGVRVC